MEDDVVIMGKIVGPHGIKGWLKVHPFTEEIGTL
nr:ribosome maturation factor RimM [Betaproteobacteria bacterium]